MSECAKNLLKGNIPLKPHQRSSLKKRKAAIRQLAKKKVSLQSKKKIIQRGGFLGAFLGPIISILGGLLNQ